MDEYVKIGMLPSSLLADIGEAIRFYTVAFVRDLDGRRDPGVVGSGVLVSAGGVRAILTADHVLRALPERGRIGIFLTRGSALESLDACGVSFLHLGRGSREAEGPDLGALLLAPGISSTIGAKRSFYNLDVRREEILSSPPANDAGVWAAQGFLEEQSIVERGASEVDFYAYNFTGFGAVDAVLRRDGHDYVEFPVSGVARDDAPRSWGGMSGGGLWQVPLRQGDPLSHGKPLLSGILFYQHPTSEQTCGVKGHSWRSVYDVAYTAIAACK